MAIPNDSNCFPSGVSLNQAAGLLLPSTDLVTLLTQAREGYDWPFGTGALISQSEVVAVEQDVANWLTSLSANSAHQIVCRVSCWAGNNLRSKIRIWGASPTEKGAMLHAIQLCLAPGRAREGIDSLSRLPGLRLVIASKIYRFLKPLEGAAVDRHASYFFNSLSLTGFGTAFVREWSNKDRSGSRLAAYTASRHRRNLAEYFEVYLPLLERLANFLNHTKHAFHCPVTNHKKDWTPADVEMAAYFWWARNGSR
ncbi:hypothetical protein DXT77_14625 [Pseudomonas sp. 91RF]|jgi:hypothetical protein|uniref:hypothetical protein n=1 Tax=Pseudomonas sp. 91RF TaxID=2292261 RepID=UPI000E66DBA7|nr:hypothetical protein [Pseudomonas sp. 91RF]RIJ09681.1 hypothetical protein DXT77_14625 [Pseudomonas sp. 91RF]